MPNKQPRISPPFQQGLSMIEVLLALFFLSSGLLFIFKGQLELAENLGRCSQRFEKALKDLNVYEK